MTGKGGQPLPTKSFIEIKMHHPNYQYATGLLPILILAMLLMAESLVGQEFDPLKIKGDLQKIGEPLGKLFRLKSKNGKLAPDFSKDRQTS